MPITKNIQFSQLIKAKGKLREFNFRRPGGLQGTFFNIDVVDEGGQRYFFNLALQEGQWRIQTNGLPSWITDAEPSLHKAIQESGNG